MSHVTPPKMRKRPIVGDDRALSQFAFLRARGGIRTHDLRLRRATLYPAELLAQIRTGSASPFLKMVGATGFEPATSCSRSRRATGLRYAPPTLFPDTVLPQGTQ